MNEGRTYKTSCCIIDAQSVKNTDTAAKKGYDAGKKISGIKRHIIVDTNGFLHVLHVNTANVTNRKGALEMFSNYTDNLSEVDKLLVDGGNTGEKFAKEVIDHHPVVFDVIKSV